MSMAAKKSQPDEVSEVAAAVATVTAPVREFIADLISFVEHQQEEYRETAQELGARELMAHSEAEQSLPELKPSLSDERTDNAEPISTE